MINRRPEHEQRPQLQPKRRTTAAGDAEEARKYLLKEHGINVPLIEVMENVNGVGVIRQDTERNYKNLRAALDKPFFFVQRASLSLLGVVWPLTCPSSSTSIA